MTAIAASISVTVLTMLAGCAVLDRLFAPRH